MIRLTRVIKINSKETEIHQNTVTGKINRA